MAEGKPSERQRAADRIAKIQGARDRHRHRNIVIRVAWVLAAVIVVLAGIAMIVLPGPALLVIPIGLAMLSLEFAWAGRVLERAMEEGAGAKSRFAAQSPQTKAFLIIAGVCAALAALGIGLYIAF
jgi:uncharacterized protein (TIGR02611 family)